MKKNISYFVVIVLISFVFVGCKKENINKTVCHEDFNYVGINHNIGLDKAFNYLQKNKNKFKNKLSARELIEETDEKVVTPFLRESFVNDIEIDIAIEQKDFVKNELLNNPEFYSQSYTDSVIESFSYSLEIKNILKEILNCSADDNIEYTDKIIFYKSFYEKVDNLDLEISEKSYIYAVLSLSVATTEYWNTQGNKWFELFDIDQNKNKPSFWNKLGHDDINGAVLGGIGGLIVGVVGAGPGALGGGLIGSMGTCVDGLWDYYTNKKLN